MNLNINLITMKNRLELLKRHYNKTLDKSVLKEMKQLIRFFNSLDNLEVKNG